MKAYEESKRAGRLTGSFEGAGYIEFTAEKVTAYTAYAKDAVIKLTKEGVDLAEGTTEDAGVDV